MTAQHARAGHRHQLTLAGLLVIAVAMIGVFLHVGAAHADDNSAAAPKDICIPVVDPQCVLPTDTTSDTGQPTDTGIPTDTTGPTDTTLPTDTTGPTDTTLPTGTTGPTDTTSAPDPVTSLPSSSTASLPPVTSTSAVAGSSSAVPVGTLGSQPVGQDGPVATGQNCGGLVCASSGYDPTTAASASVQATGTQPVLANTGSASKVSLELSLLLLGGGVLLLVLGSGRVGVLASNLRRRH